MAQCRISNLVKRFGAATAVRDVSLDIRQGEFVVILGPSGCGKTTTLRMIAGLITPDEGTIQVGDRVVSDPANGVFIRPEHRDIGMVFQSYAIWPHMNVAENVAYPLRVRRLGRAEREAKVRQALELVGLAAEAQRPATALSGGQMQRVALARALVFDPALVLYDEPLSNLDLKLRERLRAELKALQQRTGVTSIYVTHDQIEAVELADRIVVMERGRAVQVGTPLELYREPRTRFVAEFISTANIFDGRVESVDGGVARVETPDGHMLLARGDDTVAAGEAVHVVVHPEDCVLGAAGGLPVRIVARRFQGTSSRYTVRWGGVSLDVVELGTTPRFAPDTETILSIPAERARLVPRETV